MQILEASESSIDATIARYSRSGIVQVPLFGAGFIMGATEANATLQNSTTPANGYSTKLDWRLADTLTNLGVGGINIPNVLNKTAGAPASYTSVSGKGKLNWLGWLNKGLALVVGVWAWKELKLPLGDTAYALGKSYGLGYSVGGVFDPPGAGATLNYGQTNVTNAQTQQQGGPYQRAAHQTVNLMAG